MPNFICLSNKYKWAQGNQLKQAQKVSQKTDWS